MASQKAAAAANTKKAPAKKKAPANAATVKDSYKKPKPNPDMSTQTQAERDYASGARIDPPQLHEMSQTSADVVRAGFTESMSGWKTREQNMRNELTPKGEVKESALKQETINRLDDRTVDVPTAGHNMAGAWDRMMDAPDKPDPAWYFGHNRRLGAVASQYGLDSDTVMSASAGMSPQNGPDNEYNAVSSMADAVANKRRVKAKEDVYSVPSKAEKKKGVEPRLVMRAGESRQLSAMAPEDMQVATSKDAADKVTGAKDFALEGFRSAGTNRQGGFRTMTDPDYNAVAEMETAKVPLYDKAIRMSKPDTPLHDEYEARFTDQTAARKVRLDKEADASANRQGSETIRGTGDRVDLYGLMGKGADAHDADPIHSHPILGKRGIAVPDTWVAGILSGQDMADHPDTASPAKMAGSQTRTTSSNVPGTTFPGPAAAKAAGGKKLTGNAAWGMAAVEAIQHAATTAREPGSQTNIPPVMMQEMTWTHERAEVAKTTKIAAESGEIPGHMVGNRVAKLTSGGLQGQKEFRPMQGPPSPSTKIETPGLFGRGAESNPLDTDTIRVIPGGGGSGSTRGRNSAMDSFHQSASGPAPTELAKRSAIHAALGVHGEERAARGITAPNDGGIRNLRGPR